MNAFLGIDLGTSGVKAVIIDEDGRTLGAGYKEIPLGTPGLGWAEQDPAAWWDAACSAVRQAATASRAGKEIKSIGLTGQMLGSVFLDKNLQPLMPCIIWLDQRASAERDYLENTIGLSKLLEITANYPLTGHWAPKILWLKNNRPEIYEKTRKILFPKDYLRLGLTGEIALEVSDTTGSYLFDVPKRTWSGELLRALEIPREFFPETVLESEEIAGYLRKEAAEALGLSAGIPVVAGGGDQTVGGIGNGVVKDGVVSATIGTSGVVFAHTDGVIIDRQPRAALSSCHSVRGKYCFFGCTLTAGGSFKWVRDQFAASERGYATERGLDPYDLMTLAAGKAKEGSEGLLFLPYLNGERTPYPDPDARGVFFGLSLRHGWPELVRSVMEGVTYSLRDFLEILKEYGLNVKQVRVSGGGAKSALWRQMQADIYNTVVISTNVEEGPAVGAAILAAVGAGYFTSVEEACDRIVIPVGMTEPIARNAALYDDFYHIYRELYPALQQKFADQARLVRKWS